MKLNMDIQRIAKLPKWAQDHIAHLERVIGTKDDEIAALRDDREPSRVLVPHYEHDGVFLRDNDRVRFHMDDMQQPKWKTDVDVSFSLGRQRDEFQTLDVRATEGRIVVTPEASNSIRVGVIR